MMNVVLIESVKNLFSIICKILYLDRIIFNKISKDTANNYVRVINYHGTPEKHLVNFKRQLEYYEKYFKIIDFDCFCKFLDNEYYFDNKPGLLITFDDGIKDNYTIASRVLDEKEYKGIFLCSIDDIVNSNNAYLKKKDLIKMIKNGHTIGNHTGTHHRFSQNDNDELIYKEVVESNHKLEKILGKKNNIFCWPGGEINVYQKKVFEIIKNNYKYAFDTCTQITRSHDNSLFIHRTNVEARWNINLVNLNCCGIMDYFYKNKLHKIEKIFFGEAT